MKEIKLLLNCHKGEIVDTRIELEHRNEVVNTGRRLSLQRGDLVTRLRMLS